MHRIDEAYDYCEKVIARHSKTFYKAFSLLPKEDRKAVWAVYAFCRTADDIVDEGKSPVLELNAFAFEFERFLKSEFDPANGMWLALSDVFSRYEMDVQAFRDMLEGQKMDLTINRYQTMDQLLNYSYHVAGTVGLMLLPILAPKKAKDLKKDAIALGLAMQVTNILRDVGEDLERDRIYLPQDIMDFYSVKEEDLMEGIVNKGFIELWEHLAEEAERLYQQAFSTMNEYPLHSRIPVYGAGKLYREILSTVRSKQYQVFGEKHYVSDDKKKAILASI
ncbi:phytoene/squalene synthase family protein [Falsibacillus pallidus]|uniref:Phytoene synthase n=1 Tax=Falsibacillus pallidus TaxID=493781 RepID=A0A370GR47_9BACI|nr:phytoene/squalene synthase family protein [Falsibacillus pallidus]RDI45879.1 phytoene synthase [Falsibacillus pallidus]